MRRFRSTAAILIALTLVAGACGNDDDGDDPVAEPDDSSQEDETPGEASAPGITADTVKMGVIMRVTGNAAVADVGFDHGLEAFANHVNADGGIRGRDLEFTDTKDDSNDVTKNSTVFHELVEQEGVFGVVNYSSSFGAADFAVAENVPVFGRNGVGWNRGDNFFGLMGSWKRPDDAATPPMPPAVYASQVYIPAKLGVKTAAILSYNLPQVRQPAEDFCKAYDLFGVDCAFADLSIPYGFTDLGATVNKIKDAGVKYIFTIMDIQGTMTVIKSLKRAGLDDVIVQAASGYGQSTVDSFPADQLEPLVVIVGQAPFEADLPAINDLKAQMKKDFPNDKLSTAHVEAWLIGTLIRDGLEAAGKNPTRDSFVKAIRSFTAWNGDDLATSINWSVDPQIAMRAPGWKPDPKACGGYILRVDTKAKKWVQVGPKPTICTKGATTAAELAAVVKADKSSLEP